MFSVRAEVTSKSHHRPFLTRVRTVPRHILRPQRVPPQASLLTPQRAKQNPQLFSRLQRKQRIKAIHQNQSQAKQRMNSAQRNMPTRTISITTTMMIFTITRTRRIIGRSIRIIDDGEYLNEVTKLCKLYYERWGKEVDCLALPAGINLVQTLERIVDTGESPIVGWAKINEIKANQASYSQGR